MPDSTPLPPVPACHPRLIPLGPSLPRRGNAFSRRLGLLLLRLIGWRVTGHFPDVKKAVVIVAPHTSNADGLVTVATLLALGLRLNFFMKHTAFPWPVAGLIRWFGGVPVNREAAQDLVDASVAKLVEAEQLLVAIAPEGTRHAAPEWKSGFYRIAHRAQVPIICVGFDYARREVRLLGALRPTGDYAADLPGLLARFTDVAPRRPERLSAPLRQLHAARRCRPAAQTEK